MKLPFGRSDGGHSRESSDEAELYPIREDIADWLWTTLSPVIPDMAPITAESFTSDLASGEILCHLCRYIQQAFSEQSDSTQRTDCKGSGGNGGGHGGGQCAPAWSVPTSSEVKVRKVAKDSRFGQAFARDNACAFISFARAMGLSDAILFTANGLVEKQSPRTVLLSVLEVIRRSSKLGVFQYVPQIIEFEQEIDAEEAEDAGSSMPVVGVSLESITCPMPAESHLSRSGGGGDGGGGGECAQKSASSASPAGPPAPAKVLSLDALIKQIVGQCKCGVPYQVIKIGEGKYLFGPQQTKLFCRVLRNHVMIRVGGGWCQLPTYLEKYDPCRAPEHATTGKTRHVGTSSNATPPVEANADGSVDRAEPSAHGTLSDVSDVSQMKRLRMRISMLTRKASLQSSRDEPEPGEQLKKSASTDLDSRLVLQSPAEKARSCGTASCTSAGTGDAAASASHVRGDEVAQRSGRLRSSTISVASGHAARRRGVHRNGPTSIESLPAAQAFGLGKPNASASVECKGVLSSSVPSSADGLSRNVTSSDADTHCMASAKKGRTLCFADRGSKPPVCLPVASSGTTSGGDSPEVRVDTVGRRPRSTSFSGRQSSTTTAARKVVLMNLTASDAQQGSTKAPQNSDSSKRTTLSTLHPGPTKTATPSASKAVKTNQSAASSGTTSSSDSPEVRVDTVERRPRSSSYSGRQSGATVAARKKVLMNLAASKARDSSAKAPQNSDSSQRTALSASHLGPARATPAASKEVKTNQSAASSGTSSGRDLPEGRADTVGRRPRSTSFSGRQSSTTVAARKTMLTNLAASNAPQNSDSTQRTALSTLHPGPTRTTPTPSKAVKMNQSATSSSTISDRDSPEARVDTVGRRPRSTSFSGRQSSTTTAARKVVLMNLTASDAQQGSTKAPQNSDSSQRTTLSTSHPGLTRTTTPSAPQAGKANQSAVATRRSQSFKSASNRSSSVKRSTPSPQSKATINSSSSSSSSNSNSSNNSSSARAESRKSGTGVQFSKAASCATSAVTESTPSSANSTPARQSSTAGTGHSKLNSSSVSLRRSVSTKRPGGARIGQGKVAEGDRDTCQTSPSVSKGISPSSKSHVNKLQSNSGASSPASSPRPSKKPVPPADVTNSNRQALPDSSKGGVSDFGCTDGSDLESCNAAATSARVATEDLGGSARQALFRASSTKAIRFSADLEDLEKQQQPEAEQQSSPNGRRRHSSINEENPDGNVCEKSGVLDAAALSDTSCSTPSRDKSPSKSAAASVHVSRQQSTETLTSTTAKHPVGTQDKTDAKPKARRTTAFSVQSDQPATPKIAESKQKPPGICSSSPTSPSSAAVRRSASCRKSLPSGTSSPRPPWNSSKQPKDGARAHTAVSRQSSRDQLQKPSADSSAPHQKSPSPEPVASHSRKSAGGATCHQQQSLTVAGGPSRLATLKKSRTFSSRQGTGSITAARDRMLSKVWK